MDVLGRGRGEGGGGRSNCALWHSDSPSPPLYCCVPLSKQILPRPNKTEPFQRSPLLAKNIMMPVLLMLVIYLWVGMATRFGCQRLRYCPVSKSSVGILGRRSFQNGRGVSWWQDECPCLQVGSDQDQGGLVDLQITKQHQGGFGAGQRSNHQWKKASLSVS